MQRFSYNAPEPVFEIDGWRVSVQVITFENVYGLDPDAIRVERHGPRTTITCNRLTWAGGQEREEGSARLVAEATDDGLQIVISASHEKKIRCVKLLVEDLPPGEVIGNFWGRSALPKDGLILSYPWPLHTPLVFLTTPEGSHVYFESLDDQVRAKRFALYEARGTVTAELLFEEAAHRMDSTVEAPPWRVGRCADPAQVVTRHLAHVESAFGLQPWESRPDVPAWAREIALVVTLHGMHWTGHVFNTYAEMLRALRWIAERLEGRRVLAFLPGWEGRYYWQYGEYRPEPRLGGDEGFLRLAQGARELGVRLMPMFGVNCANSGLKDFERWGTPSVLRTAGGLVFQGNRPDWDSSRAHDPGWQAWLNPGAPAWRQRLCDQVSRLVERYQLPAVFFDTTHVWTNDPNHPVYDGIVALCESLRGRFPQLLIAGEGWYDALGVPTPVSQLGTPALWPEIFSRYCRTFQHLSAGDPSRGSTGVHERGYAEFRLTPDEPFWWPTVAIVDDTIDRASEQLDAVIGQAKRYAERYLVS